jgi:hypothetical protein
MWKDLNSKILELSRTVDRLDSQELSPASFYLRQLTFAEASALTSDLVGPAQAWISDGRKTSEGAGLGTGVVSYYNPNTSTWLRVSDDGAVAT